MADVFISYARPDAAAAKAVAAALRAAGRSVWLDEDLPAHRSYSEVIEEQLEAASAVVVLWSKSSTASQWVRSEANRARETGRLVQLRLDDTRLPMPFDQIQCADLAGWKGNRASRPWQVVDASIADLAGSERPAVSAPLRNRPAARRTVLIAGGALAALTVGGLAMWRRPSEPDMTPEARLMMQKGLDALQQNDVLDNELPPGAGAQAVALLTQATEVAPGSASAWGGLAMAYAVRMKAAPLPERRGFAERCRAAAERALALEKNELRGLAAMRMLDTVYRNWGPAEIASRKSHALHPTFPIHIFLLSDVLGSVDRWRDAAEVAMKADRTRFLIPGADRKVVINLWAAGRLQEADKALQQAVDRWPEHPQVWRTRVAYLMFSGRPVEALALLDSAERPAAVSDALVGAARTTARALTGADTVASAVATNLAYLRATPTAALIVAQALTTLGQGRSALPILDGYYFGEGEWASLAPPGGDYDRHTSPLFHPPMRSLWPTTEFAALVDRIGLETYWRQSGTQPDFRRFG